MSTRSAPLVNFRIAVVVSLVVLVVFPGGARAAFPGVNGKIAFHRQVDGVAQIFVMDPDGSNRTQLTNASEGFGGADPDISADCNLIAYTRLLGHGSQIAIMNADGTNQTPVTSVNGFAWMPSFSPDGTKIAFSSNAHDPFNVDIYVIDVDGTDLTRLTTDPGQDQFPEFSPDGSKIVFDRDMGFPEHDIFVMNADGTNETNLTAQDNVGTIAFGADFSPDGSRIVFSAGEVGGPNDLYTVDVTGAGLTQLTTTEALHEESPAFAPDGTKIVFAGVDLAAEDPVCCAIFAIDADGSGRTTLVDRSQDGSFNQSPDWGSAQDGRCLRVLHGRATALTVAPTGIDPIIVSDTGAIDAPEDETPRTDDQHVVYLEQPGIGSVHEAHAGVALTGGIPDQVRATATTWIHELKLLLPSGDLLEMRGIRAEASTTRANAAADVRFSYLAIGGTQASPDVLEPSPNTVIELPDGGSLTLNEQRPLPGYKGGISVAAAHLVIPGLLDVVIGYAESGF